MPLCSPAHLPPCSDSINLLIWEAFLVSPAARAEPRVEAVDLGVEVTSSSERD